RIPHQGGVGHDESSVGRARGSGARHGHGTSRQHRRGGVRRRERARAAGRRGQRIDLRRARAGEAGPAVHRGAVLLVLPARRQDDRHRARHQHHARGLRSLLVRAERHAHDGRAGQLLPVRGARQGPVRALRAGGEVHVVPPGPGAGAPPDPQDQRGPARRAAGRGRQRWRGAQDAQRHARRVLRIDQPAVKGTPTMKTLRTAVPLLALAALAAAGCFLLSGQFVVNYALPDPLHVLSGTTLTAVDVDLNTISEYNDHKDDLKRVDDVALIGDFHNNAGSSVNIQAWLVPAGTLNLTPSQVTANGVLLWGPLTVAGNATQHVDWNGSAQLFKGRQTLIDEVKGDGRFSLNLLASGSFDLTVTKGAVSAVIG